ncbi:MAG: HipA domain-containing protein [Bacteroidetes bacterium]|nr:HipA domain-containing protein [Bacteroidota bacterium]
MSKSSQKRIQVCAHCQGLTSPMVMGMLAVDQSRGSEVFSFTYNSDWLQSPFAKQLDPDLGLFTGPQYHRNEHPNFGIFLDSSPDRWGKVLMRRREAQLAREEKRQPKTLYESDFLLGVYDGHRMGGLRFRLSEQGPFLDNNKEMAAPPFAKLRDLEFASLQLEKDGAEDEKDYLKWLNLLITPGSSLGGARPKASVISPEGDLWIAKFPSHNDEINTGAWEYVARQLAVDAGIEMSDAHIRKFSGRHHTFLTKRFDRLEGERLHYSSAMTQLGKKDGDNHATGVSYLHLAEFLMRNGSQPDRDLEQLWRRIVFNICISNVDDHLRNHGFLLDENGWKLSPAFDVNPTHYGNGLTLNISETDNAQDLELALQVAPDFRIQHKRSKEIITDVINSVSRWKEIAKEVGIGNSEVEGMTNGFRLVGG